VANLKTRYTDGARRGFFHLGVILAHRGFTADMMTYIGLLLQAAALPLIITGYFGWALVVGIIASLCDALDGAVARAGAGPTKAGAFLDSTLDRVSELMVAAALVVYFVLEGPEWGPIVAMLVFMGAAQMVSYVRARAEALGVDCKVGFMSRPERLVGLGIGFLFSWWEPGGTSFLVWWLYLLTALTVITVVHREVHVMRKLRALDRAPELQAPPAPRGERSVPAGADAGHAASDGDDLDDELWPAPSGRGGGPPA
jgi:CDP-diacylglycerol--glycerol-3-phosphate 3-phosphatidyltransferase